MTVSGARMTYFWAWRFLVVFFAMAAPFADLIVCIGPPWPSLSVSVFGAVVSEIMAFALAWALVGYWYEETRKIRLWQIVFGIAFISLFAFVYVSLTSRYVRHIYGHRDRVVIGSKYINDKMAEFVTSNPSKYTPEELIRQYHDVASVWEPESLANNRMALFISWCGFWFGFGLVVSNIAISFRDQNERGHVVPIEPSAHAKQVWNAGPTTWLDDTASSKQLDQPKGDKCPQEVILLIHGIRTQAEWQYMVAKVLGRIPDALVLPIKYEFFDAVRFWFPFATRNRPIGEILWRIHEARRLYPTACLSVIAHSFGTYAVGMILKDNPDVKLHRLVLCGAVLPRGYRWDQIGKQIEMEVINDCGLRDVCPVLAEWSSWGYGASGTYGFGTPGIYDRYHNFKHSGFFDKSFVTKFWLSWFENGLLKPGIAPRKWPFPWSIMTVLKIRWILAAIPFIVAGWIYFRFF